MISSLTNGISGIGPAASSPRAAASPSFGDILAETTAAAAKPAAETKPEPADRAPGSAERLADALAAYHKEASLTPAQRVRRDVLKSLNLTEETLKALPPEERKAIEQKVAAEVARRLRLGANGKADAANATQATDPAALSV